YRDLRERLAPEVGGDCLDHVLAVVRDGLGAPPDMLDGHERQGGAVLISEVDEVAFLTAVAVDRRDCPASGDVAVEVVGLAVLVVPYLVAVVRAHDWLTRAMRVGSSIAAVSATPRWQAHVETQRPATHSG